MYLIHLSLWHFLQCSTQSIYSLSLCSSLSLFCVICLNWYVCCGIKLSSIRKEWLWRKNGVILEIEKFLGRWFWNRVHWVSDDIEAFFRKVFSLFYESSGPQSSAFFLSLLSFAFWWPFILFLYVSVNIGDYCFKIVFSLPSDRIFHGKSICGWTPASSAVSKRIQSQILTTSHI